MISKILAERFYIFCYHVLLLASDITRYVTLYNKILFSFLWFFSDAWISKGYIHNEKWTFCHDKLNTHSIIHWKLYPHLRPYFLSFRYNIGKQLVHIKNIEWDIFSFLHYHRTLATITMLTLCKSIHDGVHNNSWSTVCTYIEDSCSIDVTNFILIAMS